jgi:hypothetical protein
MKTKQEEKKLAEMYGREAFTAGKICAPCIDPRCMELLQGKKVGESAPVLKAWLKGWHTGNVNAFEQYLKDTGALQPT